MFVVGNYCYKRLSNAFTVFNRFWYAVFLFSFVLRNFKILFMFIHPLVTQKYIVSLPYVCTVSTISLVIDS